jgi:hypothetical protein
MSKPITPKRKCCKDRPRCKRCPVALKRLDAAGFAERRKDGRYKMRRKPGKKALRAARA